MGFEFYYRSTRPVTPAEAATIQQAAEELTRARTWLSCEPVSLSTSEEDGHLAGSSKPNFHPHPADAAAAKQEALPDGTTRDLFEILGKLSKAHAIDWEISHDYSNGPLGYIRRGVCDGKVLAQAEALAIPDEMLGNILGGFDLRNTAPRANSQSNQSDRNDEDDDNNPSILKFKPKGK